MNYSIKEISKLTGLPSSTLRYYESVGIIKPVKRDSSSKHRTYTEEDLEQIYTISCLYAAHMPMKGIKEYFENMSHGNEGVEDQIKLFSNHVEELEEQIKMIKVRKKYSEMKKAYWIAMRNKDKKEVEKITNELKAMAKKLIQLNK